MTLDECRGLKSSIGPVNLRIVRQSGTKLVCLLGSLDRNRCRYRRTKLDQHYTDRAVNIPLEQVIEQLEAGQNAESEQQFKKLGKSIKFSLESTPLFLQ